MTDFTVGIFAMDDTQVEDMSVEQLKGRIAQQKAVIAEQRGDLQRAGVLGKCLLEQKAEQCEHIQHLAERHATNLEVGHGAHGRLMIIFMFVTGAISSHSIQLIHKLIAAEQMLPSIKII